MKEYFTLQSKDNSTALHCIKWFPQSNQEPKGILQLVHGMAEYVERYDAFANYLTEQNILVVGHDHLGHGASLAADKPNLGFFAKEQSPNILIEDVYQVTTRIQAEYPEIPYFILGHSMGSFVLRNYLGRYSDHLAGAIIMGTGAHRSELALALPLLKLLNKTQPYRPNKLIDDLAFGNFHKAFPEKRTTFDWLSKSQKNVDAYIADQKLGFLFTNNGFYTLFTLISLATSTDWATKIQQQLPVLVISGAQDPVGEFGKGPTTVARELTEAGLEDVTLQLYEELRHEILNETESPLVMSDIYYWLTKHLN